MPFTHKHSSSQSSTPNNNGVALISAIVVLENPRATEPEKPRSITFDAHLWWSDRVPSDEKPEAGMALLRYYNGNDMAFDEVGAYFINASVAKAESNGKDPEYILLGDILTLIPAGPLDAVDPCVPALVTVCGIVTEFRDSDPVINFTLTPTVYVSALKGKPQSPVFPARGLMTNPARWASSGKKPVVHLGSYVSIIGHLKHVELDGVSGVVKMFDIDLEKLTFCGKPPGPPVVASSPSASAESRGTQRKFSYADSPLASQKRRRILTSETSNDSLGSPSSGTSASTVSGAPRSEKS